MYSKIISMLFLICASGVALGAQEGARNPIGELSLMGSYSKSSTGPDSYSTSKRYAATLGVNITPVTEIELSYSYANSVYNYANVQTTQVIEQSLALSLVQSLVPPSFFFQPYLKGGGAQYNRRQSGTIYGVPTGETISKSPSALLGAGIRIFLLANFSLKVEGVTYLPDFHISEFKDNFYFQGGVSWNF